MKKGFSSTKVIVGLILFIIFAIIVALAMSGMLKTLLK